MNSMALDKQAQRNTSLLEESVFTGDSFDSKILPFFLSVDQDAEMSPAQLLAMQGLQKQSARIAIASLASLAKINELDHLGGGLDLIPAFLMTQAVLPAGQGHYTIEHAHTSIGYYGVLSALGYLDETHVIEKFRRSLDIAGHVSWVPGGTELNGGRLGVMIPAAVGHALGLKARDPRAWYICHCGDAGWISGQAMNGFNGAHYHQAPITFVMHRNGIQLSGATASIMDKDPRPMIAAMGIEIIEVNSLADTEELYAAYRHARQGVLDGKPNLIYPTGYKSEGNQKVTLSTFGAQYGIESDVAELAEKNQVDLETEIWVPGSLMSYRDVESMIECVFLVNQLPGGTGHHDGHMKGRDVEEVLSHDMLSLTPEETEAVEALHQANPVMVIGKARPAPGTPNLLLTDEQVVDIELPKPGKAVSARAGVAAGYHAVAKHHADDFYLISCDLDASTKLGNAKKELADDHQFEMSIEEQVSAIMANGLAVASRDPQLVVFSTFAAFFEGIAREGMEMWRYQRNLNGINEGLNVTFHMSHVGACTGRDHFSGWSLDWVTLGMGYLPYLHRFYTPADARSAFIAVRDLAAHYGAHIIGIPRDNLPILTKQGSDEPLFSNTDEYESVTRLRKYDGAKKAVLALGATAYLAADAAEKLSSEGHAVDAYVINGLPLDEGQVQEWLTEYPEGLVTVEDGIIATPDIGLRGFASIVSGVAAETDVSVNHVGITDPRVAPADGHFEVWAHFGITQEGIEESVLAL